MIRVRRPPDAQALRRDALLALALGLASAFIAVLTHTVQTQMSGSQRPAWMFVVCSLVLALPLVWRRRAPMTSMVVGSALYIVAATIGAMELTVSQVVLFLAFYSVGAWSEQRRRAFVVRLLVVVGMAVWLLVTAIDGFYSPETGELGVQAYFAWLTIQVAVNAAYFGGAWVFGDRSWDQALEREALERAQAEVRAQQALLTEQAISLERLRIARELHDVVAHHVSAMGIQAGAARRMLQRDPDRASTALRSVEDSARAAIAELGTMVGALRSAGESDAPMPTLADLPDLLRAAREHGSVDHAVVGDPRPVSPAVELTIYRVVQEALTNVRKHAGPAARADVRLRYRPTSLEIEIADDGTGASSSAAPGLGVGQTGMSERVAAVGGTLEMGPKSRGGYLVRATIPTRAADEADPGPVPARTADEVR